MYCLGDAEGGWAFSLSRMPGRGDPEKRAQKGAPLRPQTAGELRIWGDGESAAPTRKARNLQCTP